MEILILVLIGCLYRHKKNGAKEQVDKLYSKKAWEQKNMLGARIKVIYTTIKIMWYRKDTEPL